MHQPIPEMSRRVAAAQACVDRWLNQPFAWGSADCGRLAALAMKGMGHKVSLASFGSYKSEAAAKAALARRGFDSMEAALDAWPLMRIGHARALPADLLAMTGASGWTAIGVVLGNGRAFAFHGLTMRGQVIQPDPAHILTAWRVPCR